MDVLILVQDYPSAENPYAMTYVHTRNLVYKQQGLDFVVLSFGAKEDYFMHGIKVLCPAGFKKELSSKSFKLIISHAPNIKNHLRFLVKNNTNFERLLFFFHGHEVLKVNEYYPKPFDFQKSTTKSQMLRLIYDPIKLGLLQIYISQMIKQKRVRLIFVSQWMRDAFVNCVGLEKNVIENNSYIIHNACNEVFYQRQYSPANKFDADFLTIRPFDDPKYGIDIVVQIAKDNPDYTFHVFGKGNYFNYNKVPQNVTVKQGFFSHAELPDILNRYRCALMPTRLDAQGVMMCEMATYGIPLITSDLFITREMLQAGKNIYYIPNDDTIYVQALLNKIKPVEIEELTPIRAKFSRQATINKEYQLICDAIN